MQKYLITTFILMSVLSTVADARGLSVQKRVALLEQNILTLQQGQTETAELVLKNETLQQQIAELKGVIEEQNHFIDNLREKQKLLYVDIDSRLVELENRKPQRIILSNDVITSDDSTEYDNVNSISQDQYNQTNDTTIPNNNTIDNVISASRVITQPSSQIDYDLAFSHLRAGRYLESARGFESFIQTYPSNELTDDAYYWLGESYYVKRQYPQALAAFQSLVNKFPSSSKSSDSLLKIGYCYFEMGDTQKSKQKLQEVIDQYPDTSISRLARNRIIQINREN